jgi:hypothetical protein
MEITQPSPLLIRLSGIIDELLQTVGFRWRGNRTIRGFGPVEPIPVAIINIVALRLRRARRLITALMVRFQAGKLRTTTPRTAPAKPRTPSARKPTPPQGPRKFGWLIPLMQHEAGPYANYLRALLAEPEMQALLAATPQAARILAPACRMLGIEKEALIPAPPSLAPVPAPAPTPPQAPPPPVPGVLPPYHLRVVWQPQSDP